MRAMPSPTVSTVPTSATSTPAVKPPSCSLMILVISPARISMAILYRPPTLSLPTQGERNAVARLAPRVDRPPTLAAQALAQGLQPAAHGAVVRLASHADEQAAEDLGDRPSGELHPAAGGLLERCSQGVTLGL